MRGNDLLDKMELIDPAYIEAADIQPRKKSSLWIKWGAMAACFCLAAVTALTWPGRWNMPIPPDSTSPVSNETEAAIYNDTITGPYGPSPINGTDNGEILSNKPMISGYGDCSLTVDKAVTDGGVSYSASLTDAMAAYGETANYRVLIELFNDGVQIPGGSVSAVAEAQRLSDLGYITAMETCTETEVQGELVTATATYYFTLHATYEQLANFRANSDLGYFIMLYDEYFGAFPEAHTEAYNVPRSATPTDENPIMPFDELFTEPPCYDEEASGGVSGDGSVTAPADVYGIMPFDELFTEPPCYDPEASDGANG